MLTHPLTLANPASDCTGPRSHLFLTVGFPRFLLTALSCWLPCSVDCYWLLSSVQFWDLPSLVFFWSCGKSRARALCVGFSPKQTKESSDWHSLTPTPTETNVRYRATLSTSVTKKRNVFFFSNLGIITNTLILPSRLGLLNTPTAPLQRGKTPTNECPDYDTKQSDGEAPVMLETWGMRSTHLLPLLRGPPWPGIVAPDWALSIG